jgi:hypothetical protein
VAVEMVKLQGQRWLVAAAVGVALGRAGQLQATQRLSVGQAETLFMEIGLLLAERRARLQVNTVQATGQMQQTALSLMSIVVAAVALTETLQWVMVALEFLALAVVAVAVARLTKACQLLKALAA